MSIHTCDEVLQVHSVEVQECSHTQVQRVTLHSGDQVPGGDLVQGSWDHSEGVSCALEVALALNTSHPAGLVWPANIIKYHIYSGEDIIFYGFKINITQN